MILQTLRKFAGRSNKDMPGNTVPSSDPSIASKSSSCPELFGQDISNIANLAADTKEGGRAQEHDITALGLSPRVQNALQRAGIISIGQLMRLKDSEILGIPNIGPKGLDEIKSKLAVESLSGLCSTSVGVTPGNNKKGSLSDLSLGVAGEQMTLASASSERNLEVKFRRFLELASCVCNTFDIEQLLSELPLPQERRADLREITGEEIESLADLKRYINSAREPQAAAPLDLHKLAGKRESERAKDALERLMDWAEKVTAYEALDDEVSEIVNSLSYRERLILFKRFCLQNPLTLEDVGHQLGVTRERVRQIETRMRERLYDQIAASSFFYSVAAVIILRDLDKDATLDRWRERLSTIGFLRDEHSLELLISIGRAAENSKLSLPREFLEVLNSGISPRIALIRKPFLDKARKLYRNCGAVRLVSLLDDKLSAAEAEQILLSGGFIEVHPGWWMKDIGKALPQRIARKVITYCGPVSPSDMRHALRRHLSRSGFPVPPSEVLVKILQHTGEFALVNGELRLTKIPANKPSLNGPERIFIRKVKADGPVLCFGAIYHSVVEGGFSGASVPQLLARSPLVRKIQGELYTMVGAEYDAQDIDRAKSQLASVPADYSLKPLPNGRIRFETNVGRWAIYGGVLSCGPAKRMEGTWTTVINGHPYGELVVERGFIRTSGGKWVFEALNIVAGDRVRIEFNTWNREAVITRVEK